MASPGMRINDVDQRYSLKKDAPSGLLIALHFTHTDHYDTNNPTTVTLSQALDAVLDFMFGLLLTSLHPGWGGLGVGGWGREGEGGKKRGGGGNRSTQRKPPTVIAKLGIRE